jgi:hypothetical protein
MRRTSENLTLADAKRMLNAGEAKANELGIAYNILARAYVRDRLLSRWRAESVPRTSR